MEEFEEKVNIKRVRFAVALKEKNIQSLPLPSESSGLPASIRSAKNEHSPIENHNFRKELKVVLSRLSLPINKTENPNGKEQNTLCESSTQNEPWIDGQFEELKVGLSQITLPINKTEKPNGKEQNTLLESSDHTESWIDDQFKVLTNITHILTGGHELEDKVSSKENKTNYKKSLKSIDDDDYEVESSPSEESDSYESSGEDSSDDQCSAAQRKIQSYNKKKKGTNVSQYHECKLCDLRFSSNRGLEQHLKITHPGSKLHPCNVCVKAFTSQFTLKQHMLDQHASDTSSLKVSCNICHRTYSNNGSLNRHIRQVHKQKDAPKKVSCPRCSKILSAKSIATHMHTHLQDKEFTCNECNKVFFTKENIIIHIKSHHLPAESVKCELCEYVTTNNIKLSVHKIKKHSEPKYICKICGKKCYFKNQLEKHEISHSDEKPFVCKLCGKRFKREQNLDQHQYVHSNERSHQCAFCDKLFQLKRHLKQHMIVHGIGHR